MMDICVAELGSEELAFHLLSPSVALALRRIALQSIPLHSVFPPPLLIICCYSLFPHSTCTSKRNEEFHPTKRSLSSKC